MPRVPAAPANGKPRCLQVLVGNMGRRLRCGDLRRGDVCQTKPAYISEFALVFKRVVDSHLCSPSMNVFICFYIGFFFKDNSHAYTKSHCCRVNCVFVCDKV